MKTPIEVRTAVFDRALNLRCEGCRKKYATVRIAVYLLIDKVSYVVCESKHFCCKLYRPVFKDFKTSGEALAECTRIQGFLKSGGDPETLRLWKFDVMGNAIQFTPGLN
ncbi:MAG TPA: hypothetical protein VJH55_00080 [Candidatus Paceibacterota bacterium]